jgi:hypothetical protein
MPVVPRAARPATVGDVRRLALGLSLCLALWLAGRPAGAVVFQDAGDRFRLDFQPRAGRVCVVVPPAESKPEDCAGTDLETLRRLYAGGPELKTAIAVVRGEAAYNLLYAVQSPGIASATPATAAGFAQGLVTAARSAAPSGQVVRAKNPAMPFAIERHGGTEVIRVELVFERVTPGGAASEIQEQTTFAVLGDKAVHCLYLVAPRELAAEARRDVDAALARVEVVPPRSGPYRLGRALGRVTVRALLLAVAVGSALVGAVAVLVGWRRRRAGERK